MRATIGTVGSLVIMVTLAASATLAGCGNVAAPGAGGPFPGVTLPTSSVPGPPPGNRAEAVAFAGLLLSRVARPAGARLLPPSAPLPAVVSRPAFGVEASPSLDLDQVFVVAQPMAAVAAALAAHVPAGLAGPGTGGGSGPGSGPYMEVDYTAQAVPAGIAGAELVLTIAPSGPGSSLLRADAEVIWYLARTAAEYIDPARYHVLTITATIIGRPVRTVRKVVTSPSVIARLAEALDRSPAEPDETIACPAESADYLLALSVSRSARPVVVISARETSCGGSGITVAGRAQPPLADYGAVPAVIDPLLHLFQHP